MVVFQTWVEFGGTHHHLWPNLWSMKSWKMQLLTSSNLTSIIHRQAPRKKKQLDNNITLPAKSIQTFSPLLSKLNCTRFFSPSRSLLPLTHKNLRSQSLQKVLSSTVKNNSVSSPKKEGGFGACIGKGLEKVCSFNWGSKRD